MLVVARDRYRPLRDRLIAGRDGMQRVRAGVHMLELDDAASVTAAAANVIAGGQRDRGAGNRRPVVGAYCDFDVKVAVGVVVTVLVIGHGDTRGKG